MQTTVIGTMSVNGQRALLDSLDRFMTAKAQAEQKCTICFGELVTADEREAGLCGTHLELEENKIYRKTHAGKRAKNYRTMACTQKMLKELR